ncbi:hypothetical protein ACIBQ1_19590 [Nonomuraea sp. NPDC050153]|uniref:hypothetical protein n=1 Tax=Nonomuraea sp. NPDC050153 TaxID=3364359 RepID=UPI00379C6D76
MISRVEVFPMTSPSPPSRRRRRIRVRVDSETEVAPHAGELLGQVLRGLATLRERVMADGAS